MTKWSIGDSEIACIQTQGEPSCAIQMLLLFLFGKEMHRISKIPSVVKATAIDLE